ncbi:DUF4247 domain-containing protein [Metabacillus arenae]|uniref:DUF4247 domain-containing protein n=1 Tax=Metabacillus arenae TaxID=2771434 RepID=A0A926NM17_9BACI|nr:DUF4247 domain-containing protein [Metabacillus arenae]MBD1380301.1 DUF4247 domain-containing protein [Metabacillus arenae]
MKKPLFFVLLSFILILAACGNGVPNSQGGSLFRDGIAEFINNNYTFQDTVTSQENSEDFSEIYSAENKTIDEVARELQEYETPEEISDKNEDKQVLIYDEAFVTLTKDENNDENTLVEIATYGFVRDNYHPSFFNGLLTFYILDRLLGNNWANNQRNKCKNNPGACYGGYGTSGGTFKGSGKTPSVRGGSSSVRGGGPGTGK